LGFETKMGVALTVVPGIVAAWMWIAPAARGRLHALRQLLAGGVAMVLVGGAWPALVELTPAGSRPWISGTSDNRILSLIFEYNGLGRVDGQAGGPAAGPGGSQNNMFGGSSGPLRLLNAALGGQVGWLLGFAVVTTLALVLTSRLRRRDPRSGWLLAVGGAFLVTALLFSFASGIFHPYYVSLVAPFLAALVGAGAGELFGRRLSLRLVAPLAIAAGVLGELVIRGNYPAQLHWLAPVLICTGVVTAAVLVLGRSRRARTIALAVAIAGLLLAPAVWAVDTLSYATSSTFPSGGPVAAESEGGQGFGPGAGARGRFAGGFGPGGAGAPPAGGLGRGGPPAGAAKGGSGGPGVTLFGPGSSTGGAAGSGAGSALRGGFGGGTGAGGSPFGGSTGSLDTALTYVDSHGGGTLAVSSQSGAAEAIIERDANVVGIGGFSGRESEVTRSWLAEEVRSGKIRWVLDEEGGSGQGIGGGRGAGGRAGGETRVGAKKVMAVVAETCSRVALSSSGSTASGTLYDCAGDAQAIAG
ncbi:MAG TPA: hypothetical protein VMB91_01095, partial [Solirubrobacteraceae bacterium]|nr:hypothetical protein [Solirubrobacteraceae bacterium]